MTASSLPTGKRSPVSGAAGLGAAVASETGRSSASAEAVQARGYWELVWLRFKRDKVAIASGIFIILLVLVAFVGAPIAQHFIGHGPNDIFTGRRRSSRRHLLPADPWTHIDDSRRRRTRNDHDILVLGAANRLGQDEFLRLLYGAQVSLEVACSRRSA